MASAVLYLAVAGTIFPRQCCVRVARVVMLRIVSSIVKAIVEAAMPSVGSPIIAALVAPTVGMFATAPRRPYCSRSFGDGTFRNPLFSRLPVTLPFLYFTVSFFELALPSPMISLMRLGWLYSGWSSRVHVSFPFSRIARSHICAKHFGHRPLPLELNCVHMPVANCGVRPPSRVAMKRR